MTLAGWVAWSLGDHPEARVALSLALARDPDYLFAQLLHRACNDGMDPELLRRCLRRERAGRAVHAAALAEADRATAADRTREASENAKAAPRTGRRRRAASATVTASAGAPRRPPDAKSRPWASPLSAVPGDAGSGASGGVRRPTGPAGAKKPRREGAHATARGAARGARTAVTAAPDGPP
ncbi:hypothetical protein GCM10020000_20640 [Streptomyces olivoverticillatus]